MVELIKRNEVNSKNAVHSIAEGSKLEILCQTALSVASDKDLKWGA